MNMLIPGIAIGVVGLIAGKSIRDKNNDIADTLKPLDDALNDLGDMFEDYKNTYASLKEIYMEYQYGGTVDWNDATNLEQQLKIKELALDNQVTYIASMIEEVEYGGL